MTTERLRGFFGIILWGQDMAVRSFITAGTRRFAYVAMLVLLVFGSLPAASAQPAAAPSPTSTSTAAPLATSSTLAALEPLRLSLDQIEAAINRDGLTFNALLDLRQSINAIQDTLRAQAGAIEPRLADIDLRLKELGAPPLKNAPPEDAAISAERAQLAQLHRDLDAASKQAKLLGLRADQMAERVSDRRRAMFTQRLLERSSSILDPFFWVEVGHALPGEIHSAHVLLQSWWGYAVDHGGYGRMIAAAATFATFVVLALLFVRWWDKRRNIVQNLDGQRFTKAMIGLRALAETSLGLPVVVLTMIGILNGYDLLPQHIYEIVIGLLVAVSITSFARGVGHGLMLPERPECRLLALEDDAAAHLNTHLAWAARVLGAAVFFNVLHKEMVAPVALTIATSALLALMIGALVLDLLARIPSPDMESGRGRALPPQWLRGFGWAVVAGIILALVTGYIGVAAFIAERVPSTAAVLGAMYLALVATDALFSDVLTADTPRTRSIAANLGLRPRGVELLGTLLSAMVRILIIIAAAFFAIAPRGLLASEIFNAMHDAAFGFHFGGITISLSRILGAALALLAGLLITRAIQRWLATHLLPRTRLDPSLQLSITTILGYVGFIAALALALGELGIDLQKIALVAGALSVGIGFGLQSIVSNFVSGLILLAERPIRVGDSIVVKGEEGYVRRISVRATEIETFERATVIIPNSELITGVVKNWTHANTLGRIIIKVGVPYETDPELVRDILLACAGEHPQVVQAPPPRAFITTFGDFALYFELRCVVKNVDDAPSVKSDLYFQILGQFRAKKITIAMSYPRPKDG